MGTGALRGVEREIVGCWVGIADACGGAHETLGEVFDGTSVLVENHNESFTLLHGDGDGFLETVCRLDSWLQLVNDHLNVMVLVAIDFHAACNLQQLTINADVQIPLAAHRLEEFTIVTFTTAH